MCDYMSFDYELDYNYNKNRYIVSLKGEIKENHYYVFHPMINHLKRLKHVDEKTIFFFDSTSLTNSGDAINVLVVMAFRELFEAAFVGFNWRTARALPAAMWNCIGALLSTHRLNNIYRSVIEVMRKRYMKTSSGMFIFFIDTRPDSGIHRRLKLCCFDRLLCRTASSVDEAEDILSKNK